jgi:adenylate cyclase
MSDVFISYARSTAPQARGIAEALRSLGYDVWRDDELPVHRAYSEVIEERLSAAKAVVVVWSAEAARSQWVQSEADRARAGGKLVQLTIDGAPLPMPFDRIECADMTGWAGDLDTPSWRKVTTSVAELVGETRSGSVPLVLPSLPSKASIAVVPFANLSNDPEQDYFVEGVVEEIVASLARFKSIFVVAAAPGLVAKGKVLSPQDAARQLGVRYLLEGSVRKAAGRVRIAVHLIDAADGERLWSDRLDDTMDDIFALQDRVAARVAGVIPTTVEDLDILNLSKRPNQDATSYDLYLRSLPLFSVFRKSEMLSAVALLDQAIAIDPDYALALSQSAVCHRQIIEHGWTDDAERDRRRGLDFAERALSLAPHDAKVLGQVAIALPGLDGNLARALPLIHGALKITPDSSFVWLISGCLALRNGDPDLAGEHLETSMRLDPISRMNGLARMYLASVRFQQGRFEEALALFRTTTLRLPISYAVLAATQGHLGNRRDAQDALSRFGDLAAGTIDDLARIWFPQPEHRKLFLDGLALAEADAA